MKINHAILHVLDFTSCVHVFAEEEMDPAGKMAKGFVAKHVGKALSSIDNKRGTFAPDSGFAEELQAYARGELGFVDLSAQIAAFVGEELGRADKAESTDVLVVDFEQEEERSAGELNESQAEAAYRGRARRYFAIMLLESKQAYMHEVKRGDSGLQQCEVARHHAILPNPSQKVASYALVDMRSLAVQFSDKPRKIAGEERWLIPDGLLQCSMQASSKEAIQTVARIVEDVAEEYGANTATALSRAKAYVSENVAEFEEIVPEELGREVFGEGTPLLDRYEAAVAEEALPARIAVEREAAKRVARNHKIRTDTGIEITFPAEYGRNPDFIEFVSGPDGKISIELKNISHIENR